MSEQSPDSPADANDASPELITLTISFYSTVRNTTGIGSVEKQWPKKTPLQDVLLAVQEEYFLPKRTHFLKSDGADLEPGFICLVDDADYRLCGGISQSLRKPAKITLISSLHGG
jgi:hypothetical protein